MLGNIIWLLFPVVSALGHLRFALGIDNNHYRPALRMGASEAREIALWPIGKMIVPIEQAHPRAS